MKFSAILLPTLVVALSSLTVTAQDHPKHDTAGVHHEHKGPEGKDGKKIAPKDKPANAGKDGKPGEKQTGPGKDVKQGEKPAHAGKFGKSGETPAADAKDGKGEGKGKGKSEGKGKAHDPKDEKKETPVQQ